MTAERVEELRRRWLGRCPAGDRLPMSEARALFNDLRLYPSASQVYEMCRCAREEDEGGFYLTFGEFCVFASELETRYRNRGEDNEPPLSAVRKARGEKAVCSYDVFLGGSCNPTTWRRDSAIPFFKARAVTYYNPQQPDWTPELVELEHRAKQSSKALFFVLNEQTRNVASMIETAFLAGSGRNLVVTIVDKYPGTPRTVNGEALGEGENADLSAGLLAVRDLIERGDVPVFDDIDSALRCTCEVVKAGKRLGELEEAPSVKHARIRIGDALVRCREAFEALDASRSGRISFDDMKMAFRIHAHRDLTDGDLQRVGKVADVDFDRFCRIVTEFKAESDEERTKNKSDAEEGCHNLTSKTSHFCQSMANFLRRAMTRNDSYRSSRPRSRRKRPCRRASSVRDVYLGGSADVAWRESAAIPALKKNGLTFFNPRESDRHRRLTPIGLSTVDNSRVLFFVISGESRGVSEMVEASYYIGQGCDAVLCLRSIDSDALIDGRPLSPAALKDYNRGRRYLSDIANREGVPVFEDIDEGLDCVIAKCKSKSN